MSNRLADETSPYLLQHRDNPVDWHPWGEEALGLARRERMPILLSIGYSACHWCHVMAHESFEDPATAAAMNRLFVNVKVDREERPDLDRLYQLAHQAIARRGGGWPLTVFLEPDGLMPFFAGTYFPKTARHGLPPFVEVLERVREWFDGHAADMHRLGEQFRPLFEADASGSAEAAGELSDAPIGRAVADLRRVFDPEWGGFGRAPKFPHCAELELLFERGERDVVEHTLAKMAEGGIHDQLGGGFARYSVDERWAIPHFEKMLYDNAQLLPLYARASEDFSRPDFAGVARGIVGWLEREMRAPEGGYWSALDADSEGEEGRFYVWQREQARTVLEPDEWAILERRYGLDRPANFEGHAWNPVLARPLESVCEELGVPVQEAERMLGSARGKLHAPRAKRVRPGTDDKILTGWNALAAAGLARAARVLGDSGWGERAIEVVDFLRRHLWLDGRLYASFKAQRARFPAYLDDHAFLLAAVLETLCFRFDGGRLAFALELADTLIERFQDAQNGGFFFTAHDHERLIGRPKPWADESVPSGNGVAARALLLLGHLLGENRYLDAAEGTLRAAWASVERSPQGHATLLRALGEWREPPTQVVLRLPAGEAARAWLAQLPALEARGLRVVTIDDRVAGLPGLLDARAAMPGGVAYVCRGTQCLAPVRDPGVLREAASPDAAIRSG